MKFNCVFASLKLFMDSCSVSEHVLGKVRDMCQLTVFRFAKRFNIFS